MSHSLANLKSLSDEELIKEHDAVAVSTVMGANYYLDELRQREQSRIATRMEGLTNRIYWFTVVVTVATILNVAFSALLISKT